MVRYLVVTPMVDVHFVPTLDSKVTSSGQQNFGTFARSQPK
jgi:hypothetical protein